MIDMKKYPSDINADQLIDMWESLGKTGLFKLQIDWDSFSLSHIYSLKNTGLKIKGTIYNESQNNIFELRVFSGDTQITSGDFWEKVPTEYKKILSYHLDKIL